VSHVFKEINRACEENIQGRKSEHIAQRRCQLGPDTFFCQDVFLTRLKIVRNLTEEFPGKIQEYHLKEVPYSKRKKAK
jgi:hypothetical protein